MRRNGQIVDFHEKIDSVHGMFLFGEDHYKSGLALIVAQAATLDAMASLARAFESAVPEGSQKAAPDTPKHPGWPAGVPASGQSAEDRSCIAEILAEAVKTAIRVMLARAEYAPDPRVRIAALLAELWRDKAFGL